MSGIEIARRKLHLSKEYVENATGYKGSGTPTMSELASLCVLFGVPSEELLKDYPAYTDNERDAEHLQNFKQIMKEAKAVDKS